MSCKVAKQMGLSSLSFEYSLFRPPCYATMRSMNDHAFTRHALTNFQPRHDFFVGVDSDGCVFDTMAIKQKQCFHGLIAATWNLQCVEAPLRATAEFVNLYSRTRGSNRFHALLHTFDLLRQHPGVTGADVAVPRLDSLRRWLAEETMLGNPALEARVAATGDPELHRVLAWSLGVNREVEAKVQHVPPFAGVRDGLRTMGAQADIVVVSQTPAEALVREWAMNELMNTVTFIAGQELGTKAEHIAMATQNRYTPSHILMIGDAPGDKLAAKANDALFFPINPGQEEASWRQLYDEAFDRFIAGTYAGDYERDLIAAFDALLPESPPWILSG